MAQPDKNNNDDARTTTPLNPILLPQHPNTSQSVIPRFYNLGRLIQRRSRRLSWRQHFLLRLTSPLGASGIYPRTGRTSSMSDESITRDLFDRWERVWHEGQYDPVPSCVAENYMRHDEKAIARSHAMPTRQRSPRCGRSGRAYVSSCTTTRLPATARGFALPSSGLIQRPASRAVRQACSPTALRAANSRRLGLCSSHSARHGQILSRKSIGRARRQ
mgnify:CR=1 FL=1